MSSVSAHLETRKRLRVLIIAEAANPEWVSVPLIGWSLSVALRKVCDVHIVTQVRNRGAFLRAGMLEGKDFTAIDSEAIAAPVHRIGETLRLGKGKGWTLVTALSSRLSYPYFERLVWKAFGPAICEGAFDIIHRVTPLTPTANSSLAVKVARAGVPFVIGPLNGGVPWPKGFDKERRREKEWLSYVRAAYKLSWARQRMLKAASAIIAGSRFTAEDLPRKFRNKITLVPENAVDPTRFSAANVRSDKGTKLPLRGCFVGRLVPYKGPDMLIEAAEPFLRSGQLVLDMLGDGPLNDDIRGKVASKGLQGSITLHGWVKHQDVEKILADADILTFPSVREFGGGVVLEAMALGVVPVICDYAGPAELVSDATGYKAGMGNRQEVIVNFRKVLGEIINDPSRISEKSKAAVQVVADHYSWDSKAQQIREVYDWVLSKKGPIPTPIPLETPLWSE